MAKVLLDYMDGHYSTRLLTDDDVADCEAKGIDVAYVEDRVLAAWHRHCDDEGTWQALWRSISNEQYVRRRERELMPLEEAGREIERLKEELARSKRMERYYAREYAERLGEKHRAEYGQFTCVFPIPGCVVDALPTEWCESAAEILEQYDEAQATEGLTRQGCCCGHDHEKLGETAVQKLRDAGFEVEHEMEES